MCCWAFEHVFALEPLGICIMQEVVFFFYNFFFSAMNVNLCDLHFHCETTPLQLVSKIPYRKSYNTTGTTSFRIVFRFLADNFENALPCKLWIIENYRTSLHQHRHNCKFKSYFAPSFRSHQAKYRENVINLFNTVIWWVAAIK